MIKRIAISIVTVVATLIPVASVAQASTGPTAVKHAAAMQTTSHAPIDVSPLITTHVWVTPAGVCAFGNPCWMWDDPYIGNILLGSSGSSTDIGVSQNCSNGGFCEHVLPDGNCMAYYASGVKGTNLVDEHACNGANFELWGIDLISSPWSEWLNLYTEQVGPFCSNGNSKALTEVGGDSGNLRMNCPPNTLPTNAQWKIAGT